MTYSETKRCHFVPKTYLDKFYQNVNNKKLLIAKSKPDGNIFHPTVSSICVRKHLYTLPGESVEDRQIIEKFYSENIEANYNKVYSILQKPKNIRISTNDRQLIISTIVTLLFRNPLILDRFNEFWAGTIGRLFERAENSPTRSFMIEHETINVDSISKKEFLEINKDQNKEIFNISHIRLALRLIELRLNDCISITEIQDGHEYITSDNPVSFTNPQAIITGMFDPNNYLRLPINPKKCIVIYPSNIQECNPREIYRRKIKSNSALVDTIMVNRLQYFNANKLIIGSFKSLKDINNQINMTQEELVTLAARVKSEMIIYFNEEIRKRFTS
jgi:hypothetical protein